MTAKEKKANFICLDVGSDKIGVIAAEILFEDKFEVIHSAVYASDGFRTAKVHDFEKAERSISIVLDKTENIIKTPIDSVSVIFSGGDIKSHYVTHNYDLNGEAVKKSDISSLATKTVEECSIYNRTVLHCFPIDFSIDNHKEIHNPVGMSGNLLTCDFHLTSTSTPVIQGLTNCFAKCNVNVDEFLLSSVVEGVGYCRSSIDNMWTLIIDFGYLSTTFTILADGVPFFSSYVPVGGYHVTSDLAQVLSIDFTMAEKVKILFCDIDKSDSVVIDLDQLKEVHTESDIPGLNNQREEELINKTLETRLVNDIVLARLKETLLMIKEKICEKNPDLLNLSSKKIVITGGGSQIKGLKSLCANCFEASYTKDSTEYWTEYQNNTKVYSSLFAALEYRVQNYYNYYKYSNSKGFFAKIINSIKKMFQ